MSLALARKYLDAARSGRHVSAVTIRRALEVSGDLARNPVVRTTRRMPNYGRTL